MTQPKKVPLDAKKYLAAFEKWLHDEKSWDESAKDSILSGIVKKRVTPRQKCVICGAVFPPRNGSGTNSPMCIKCKPPPRRFKRKYLKLK